MNAEELKFSDLKTEVEHSEIRASATSDVLPEYECDHWVTVKRSGHYGYASNVSPDYWTHTYCPKCGEKL